jgi:uncharacterized membrane protein YcjF (UPF0283 family)
MKKQTRILFVLVAVFILLGVVLFVINQTNQVVLLARSINESFGQGVLAVLLIFYAIVLLVPVYLFLRLPKSLKPPASEQDPEFQTYLAALGKRLSGNRLLTETSLDFLERRQIEEALARLNERADESIKKAAAAVFVSTAISQSGRLDAFAVLAAQVRLVWQVAHVYQQRPSFREMLQLYANVGAATFLALELEDLDIAQQIEPIVTNVVGASLAGMVPGVKIVASVVTNSLLDGTANAFLTLRIGAITKQYCGSLTRQETRSIRRLASAQAARMLGSIVLASSKKVTSAIYEAARKKTGVRSTRFTRELS